MSSAPPPRDPGLQAERTLLSWQRTVILLVAVALLYVRDPFASPAGPTAAADPLVRVAVALLPLAVAAVAVVLLRRRWRRAGHGLYDRRTGRPPAPLAGAGLRILLCAGTALFAVAVAVTSLPAG
ncbi:DUF202 domain-containing protein [Nocardiopsis coralliicola]